MPPDLHIKPVTSNQQRTLTLGVVHVSSTISPSVVSPLVRTTDKGQGQKPTPLKTLS